MLGSLDYFLAEGNGTSLDSIRVPAVYGIGLNYRKFALQAGLSIPELPLVFSKPPTAITVDKDAPVVLPRHLRSDKVDYEGELAVVIGKVCKNVSTSRALNYVAGYCAALDITARDWQFEWGNGQFTKGKSFDSFCALGPEIIPPSELDGDCLALATKLNEDLVQHANTSDLIFSIPELIAFLSGSTTLLPGTIILTGTPGGVGHTKDPPVYLKPGDQLEVLIEGIGSLKRSVIDEDV